MTKEFVALEPVSYIPAAALGLAASRARSEEDAILMRRSMATTSDAARRRRSAQPGGWPRDMRSMSGVQSPQSLRDCRGRRQPAISSVIPPGRSSGHYAGVVIPWSWPAGARHAARADV